MSKIDDLIQELCPDGVAYEKVVDIAVVGTGGSDKKDATPDGEYPFYVRSKVIARINTFEFDEEAIVIPGEGGVGEIFHYVTGRYALHQRAYRIHFTDSKVMPKFAYYHFMANFKVFIMKKAVSATVTSIRKPMITDFPVPIPPLEVQKEIVNILDKFTQLEAELSAELDARRKQYKYYRNQLLVFNESREEVKWPRLSDIARVTIGEFVHKNKQNPSGQYPVYNGGRSETGYFDDFNNTGEKIVISARGAYAGFVNRVMKPYWAGNSSYSIDVTDKNKVNWHYVYYYLKSSESKFTEQQQKGGIPAVSKKQVEVFKIPIPPLDEQNRIVSILDKFDNLINSISEGLPAEINARRRQYEYYRTKLLTFQELPA